MSVMESASTLDMSRGVSASTLVEAEEMYNIALDLRNQLDPAPSSRLEVAKLDTSRFASLYFVVNPGNEDYVPGVVCDTLFYLVNFYKDRARTEQDGFALLAADKRIDNGFLALSSVGSIPLVKSAKGSRYVLEHYSVYNKDVISFIDWSVDFLESELSMLDPRQLFKNEWNKGCGGVALPWDGNPTGNFHGQEISGWKIKNGFYPWLETNWGQEGGYVKFFPKQMTGSVIPALAQVLAYYKVPINGTLSCNEYNGVVNPNWDQILEDSRNNSGCLDEESTPVSLNQVAALYRFLGDRINPLNDEMTRFDIDQALNWVNVVTNIEAASLQPYTFETIKRAVIESLVVVCTEKDVDNGRTWLIG